MSSRNLLMIGSSGQAKVCLDIARINNNYHVVGLLDDYLPAGDKIGEFTILGAVADFPRIWDTFGQPDVFIAIGDNWKRHIVRESLDEQVREVNYATLIHPRAVISSSVQIGVGCAVMAGAVIGTECTIGDFCIINTNASIDHESVMMPFSSLAPGAATGGRVTINDFSAIGIGASVSHKLTIGPHTVVGAGSVVARDIPGYCVAFGVPAKYVKPRQKGDIYL